MDLKSFCYKFGYELKTSIDWEWDRYGDGLVSVTTILNLIEDPGFEFVKRNHADAVKAACERGTRIHNEAEDFFNASSKTVDKRIMKFHVLYDVEIISQEQTFTKEGVRGNIDLIGNVASVKRNVDYKSSAKKNPKYYLQLAGYFWLNGLPGSLLYLSAKDFVYEEVDVGEYLPAFLELKELFFSLLNEKTGRLAFTQREST